MRTVATQEADGREIVVEDDADLSDPYVMGRIYQNGKPATKELPVHSIIARGYWDVLDEPRPTKVK
jgi:hypothetical protein